MIISDRLRTLREARTLSQGDIEKRTGLLRCYISRVENGHTVPSIDTLAKLARALGVPMYQLFFDGDEPARLPDLPKHGAEDNDVWGNSGKDLQMLNRFRRLLSKTKPKGSEDFASHGPENGRFSPPKLGTHRSKVSA
jgi:transcriptional regulator with XRE-family HTH domain